MNTIQNKNDKYRDARDIAIVLLRPFPNPNKKTIEKIVKESCDLMGNSCDVSTLTIDLTYAYITKRLKPKSLYTFQFIPEGFNKEWAYSLEEAKQIVKQKYTQHLNLNVDMESFIELSTPEEQNKYFDNIPLMD